MSSLKQSFAQAAMEQLAGVNLTPALASVFSRILSRQVELNADGIPEAKGAFATLLQGFTFVATPAGENRPASPLNYQPERLNQAITAAQDEVKGVKPEPIPEPEINTGEKTLSYALPNLQQNNNSMSFTLQYDASAPLIDVHIPGTVAQSSSVSSLQINNLVSASYVINFSGYFEKPELQFIFDTSALASLDINAVISGLVVNGNYLGNVNLPLTELSTPPKSEENLGVKYITETPDQDTTGYDSNYSNIKQDVLTLPNAQIGLIEFGTPTQAYLHIEQGDRFKFDHDTFLLSAESSGDYRIKLTPSDPSVIQGNIISLIYNDEGKYNGLLMNQIGSSATYIDGSLYSDAFSMNADEHKFLSISMRWSSNDYKQTADGPTPYQVELIDVADSSEILKFNIIAETPDQDTTGYDSNYSNIKQNVLTLPNAQIGLIEFGTPTQAYLHIEQGDRFKFDHDTFLLSAESSGDYRIKLTPSDPSVIQGNIISLIYNDEGKYNGLLMNQIGSSATYIDGSLYSDAFSMNADEHKFLSISMRWSSNDYNQTADGPTPYQVELIGIAAIHDG